jgi:branched-subunit amino acid aminotransferase/4-amino-4-deoxychorismate lyase
MQAIVLINGRFVRPEDAQISIFSDAFQRGHGVFETLKTYGDKKLFRLEDHLARLFSSAEKVMITPEFSKDEITKQLNNIIEKSSNNLQRLKIILIKEKFKQQKV